MQTSTPQFCKDCKHHRLYVQGHFCEHPNLGLSLVTGEPHAKPCIDMRFRGRAGRQMPADHCGPAAKFYESSPNSTATCSTNSGLDLVPRQTLKPGGIVSPNGGRFGGNTSIVVQVYTFGRGVTIEAESSNLLGRKGAFELEAFGKFFTFDMAGAVQAQGLVAPIQGDVAAVSLPLQAMNQKDVAELERHGTPSVKTVIVSLPPATGKTTLAEQMMTKFGCTSIVEEWCNREALTPGALHLTNQPLFAKE